MEIISRGNAKALGLTRYFTGLPCIAGHISERSVGTRGCIPCGQKRKSEWKSTNNDKVKESSKNYREKNKDKSYALSKAWAQRNKQRVNESAKRYRDKNRELCQERTTAWKREARISDPLFALRERIRGGINKALRKNGYTKRSRTHEILGCDWAFFKVHIEKQFLKGMNWNNRADWQIDHITPISLALSESEVLSLSHFTNLRPMWSEDNQSKRAHVTHLL